MSTNNKYFLVSIKGNKTLDDGKIATVVDKYLFDAVNYTEAESRASSTIPLLAEAVVDSIVKKNYTELFINHDGDKFYEFKVGFITFDDKTQTEKRTINKMLVNAFTVENALDKFKDDMKDTLSDYEIVSITETPILDVYLYLKEGNE